ncbi:MAG: HAD family phosphatase [Caldilineaceae bacterium]
MKLQAVIWDLDGTITDSATLHFQAWRATMADHGVDYTHELFLHGFGRNNFEILAEQMPDFTSAKISQVSEEKEAAYRSLLHPGALELLPGVGQWLAHVHTLGLPQAIGSSAPMANIIAMTHVLEVGDLFHALLSGYRLPRGKPDPMLFLRCAASVEANPESCLVIEDTIHGIEAAQRAGMASIVVGPVAKSDAVKPYLRTAWPPCQAAGTLADLAIEPILSWYS